MGLEVEADEPQEEAEEVKKIEERKMISLFVLAERDEAQATVEEPTRQPRGRSLPTREDLWDDSCSVETSDDVNSALLIFFYRPRWSLA